MTMHIPKPPELQGDWGNESKELVVTIDGIEIARGDITGFRLDGGTEGCSNEDCIGCIEDEVVWLIFKLPPPKEPVL